jgi:heat-inducible transcriptional repressor
MTGLTDRQKLVLKLVIREHVASAAPVGSRTLSEHYDLGVSPATVRNEMACLEDLGYLTHPHTSAGRVPTDRGYRYFVEQLMDEVDLLPAERRTIQHQFHQSRPELGQWMKLSAAVLAHTAQGAALVTAPRTVESRFKHIELIHVHGLSALLVLVTQTGIVRQEMLTLTRPLSQSLLSRAARFLNDHLGGLVAREIDALASSFSPFEAEIVEVVRDMLAWLDGQGGREVYQSGIRNVLSQPEFSTGDVAQQFLAFFERRAYLEQLLSELLGLEGGGVRVIVGTEGIWDEWLDVSFVLARYGAPNVAMGMLGVLGPTRMRYERAVSSVRFVAGLLSELIRDSYGLQEE